ncbi:MAG: hypothetical protein RR623_08250 [Bacilli bacterium]
MESIISSVSNILGGIVNGIIKLLVFLSTPFFVYSFYVIVFCIIGSAYYRFVLKTKKIKRESTFKNESKLQRLFIQFPKRLLKDLMLRDPNHYRNTGLYMFVGEQGSGKTIAMVHKMQQLKKRYPRLRIKTNMGYKYQDSKITTWQEIVNSNNGEYGEINALDEIQTWFSSKDSGNMPPEMLGQVSQQRKQSKSIFGTAQGYHRIAKEIREQTKLVYCPLTILGCLTIVRVTKPKWWDDEKMCFKKYMWLDTYFFVHTEALRNSYNTYEIVETLAKVGFKKRSETFINQPVIVERGS